MKKLLIMRHAKSSRKDAATSDFDRPLNKQGKHDAQRIGEWLVEQILIPDLIVSSAAKRAKSTAKRVAGAFRTDVAIRFTESLYLAPSSVYLNVLSELSYEENDDTQSDGSQFNCVLIIGHNPGAGHLLFDLTGEIREMPTAALAILELPIESWGELTALSPSSGRSATLKTYVQPKDLRHSDD